MKSRFFLMVTVIAIISLSQNDPISAGEWPRTGIGFRGNYWDFVDNSPSVFVHDHWGETEVDFGGYGGSVFFFTQFRPQLYFDFSIGALGDVKSREIYWHGEEVEVDAIVPLLFGVRYDFMANDFESKIRPYATAGLGAYWLSDIYVLDDQYEEEVIVDSETLAGAYGGVGLNLMLTENFAINYDVRYHLVDFNGNRYNSGPEFGLGVLIMWGKSK